MSQPNNNISYTWHEQQQLYAAHAYNHNSSRWDFRSWMPRGWRPPAQQQDLPSTPQPDPRRDSAFVSSPSRPYSSTASPYSHSYNAQASSSNAGPSSGTTFPRGEGDKVYGQYNAALGAVPGNLHYEKIDQSYYVRDRQFFKEGKVFAVILSEAAGSTVTSYNSSISEVRYEGNLVYTGSRRFVVVRCKREFCFACPIFTYSGRATLKRGVRPEEHGVVYSHGQSPGLVQGEKNIKKPSIAVIMASGEPSLHIASRIYYGIHHPTQYNVKVKDIGQVHPDHLPTLIGNWKAEDESETRQAAEVTAGAEDPELPNVQEVEEPQIIPPSHTSHRDPHLYHPQSNIYGYDVQVNPHMYHPVRNPYGYHPVQHVHGFHPTSNPCSYHPTHNRSGHHPQTAAFSYHPQFSPNGYDPQRNLHGYHPQVTPFNYHPIANVHGYHPTHNPNAYHPDYQPEGVRAEEYEDNDDHDDLYEGG